MLTMLTLQFLATEYHLGLLKAKLAKYRAQLLEPSKSSAAKVRINLRGSKECCINLMYIAFQHMY